MPRPLASAPFHLMRLLFQDHTAQWQKALQGLTKPQYSVLCAVAEQPGIEQVDLTDAALSSKATLAEMLVRMEDRGLLRREPGSSDRRRRFIWLTEAGEQLLLKTQPVANEVDQRFLLRISAEERQVLIDLLQKMTAKEMRQF